MLGLYFVRSHELECGISKMAPLSTDVPRAESNLHLGETGMNKGYVLTMVQAQLQCAADKVNPLGMTSHCQGCHIAHKRRSNGTCASNVLFLDQSCEVNASVERLMNKLRV